MKDISKEIIKKKIELRGQSDFDDKPRNIAERMDKLKSVDPRQEALDSFDPVKESISLLKIGFQTCKENKNINDITKLLNCVVRIKDSFLNDPEHLIRQLMKMNEDERSIFMSVLERDKLLTGFRKRKLDSKKIFGT